MKKLFVFLFISYLCVPTYAQFGKLLKDVEKGIKDVKKTTDDASRTAKNTQKSVEGTRKSANEAVLGSASKSNSKESTRRPTTFHTGRDFYISLNGNGREATKNQPAKELAVVVPQVQAGDRVHIAAGTYLGATERGSDIFDVPVSIIGGYSPDFQPTRPVGQLSHRLDGYQ
jgi:hypothetical protein